MLFDPLAIVRVPCCVYIISVAFHVNVHQGKSELRFPCNGKREWVMEKVITELPVPQKKASRQLGIDI